MEARKPAAVVRAYYEAFGWYVLATVKKSQSRSALLPLAPQPRLLDRQGWSTLVAGSLLLLLILFTTCSYPD